VTRRRRRLIIALVILAILIALLTIAYVNYSKTRNIGFGLELNTGDTLAPPEFMYSFGSEGASRLQRPLGVFVDGDQVFVTDSRRGQVLVYTLEGKRVKSFGKGNLLVPLYIVRNPKTNQLWVTDRRLRSIEVFAADGKWLRTFDPKLPKNQLPKFETGKVQWAPVALAFAPDGTLYVTEILNGHRLLEFDPSGKFVKSTGTVGLVEKADQAPDAFQFPNSVKVAGNEVWVADSNNRRLKVYSRDLEFKRFLATSGLPRGFDFLARKGKEPQRLVVVDTLAHDATIWEAKSAKKILNFGGQGVLDGQFSYPNDVSTDGVRRMFVADTNNGRIQVWGWPAEANPIPTPRTPLQWLFCLSPLLLLPLLLLARRKRFFATADFVLAMYAAEEISLMPGGRRRWFVTPEDYDELKGLSQGDINLGELLNSAEHSESDARALMQRFELDYPTAVTLSIAQRAKVFCTENPELRRLARVVEIEVVNRTEFIERFAKKRAEDAKTSAGGE
jgi:hypothetical protein